MKTLIAIALTLGSAFAQASTYTGTILTLQSLASPTTTGNIHIGVQTSGTNACVGSSYPNWYSIDLPIASVGPTWTAILLAAITAGKAVTVVGTGTCDQNGSEIVFSVNALP